MPSLALIISTYNQPEYLERVLEAVTQQSVSPEEVLVADDGSAEETRRTFSKWSPRQGTQAEHLWQKDEGFRKARILNQAIARANSEYLVFLDGDTVPHPWFIADHLRLAEAGAFVQGHRALISEGAVDWFGRGDFNTDRRRAIWRGALSGWKHAFRWPIPLVRAQEGIRGIRGCNFGVWRSDMIRVNGYNEDFVGWGREDSELAVRLMNSGVRRLDVRGQALCYHLWHLPASRGALNANDELLAQAQRNGTTRCQCGLDQYL